jgi:hypothetical protein
LSCQIVGVVLRKEKKCQAKFPKEKWNWDHMFLEDLDGENSKEVAKS